MKIRWHEIKKVENLYQLTIEGTVTPQDIYNVVKDIINYDSILITSYDMESDDFNALSQEFDKCEIVNTILSEGVAVKKGWLDCIFENTDFGESQDCYKLIASGNSSYGDYGITVDYRDIPDLKVQCKSKSYLESILNDLMVKMKNMSE